MTKLILKSALAKHVLLLGLILGPSLLLYLNRHSMISPLGGLLGLVAVWLCLLPSYIYIVSPPPRSAPFMPLTGLFYLVFFALPIFILQFGWPDAPPITGWLHQNMNIPEEPRRTIYLQTTGIACLILVFYVFRYSVFSKLGNFHLPAQNRQLAVVALLLILAVAHFAFAFIPSISRLPSIGQFLIPAGYVAIGGLFILWLENKKSKLLALIVAIVVALEFYYRLQQFLLTNLIFLGVFLGMVLCQYKLKTAIILVVISIFPLLPVYQFVVANRTVEMDFITKLASTGQAVAAYISGKNTDVEGSAGVVRPIANVVKRMGWTWVFSHVIEKTPRQVPYWKGETYKLLIFGFLPRAIYPKKPEERFGYKFGVRYGLIHGNSRHISVNLPWMIELYANFGTTGVLLGMTFFGLLMAFLDKVFNDPHMSGLEMAIGLTILFPLFFHESNFSLMVGSLPILVLSLYLYFKVGFFAFNRIFRFG